MRRREHPAPVNGTRCRNRGGSPEGASEGWFGPPGTSSGGAKRNPGGKLGDPVLRAMRPEPKKRLPTDAADQPPLASLGALLPELPAGLPATAAPAAASSPAPTLWKLGRVVLRRETARRGGKTVIVIHDFATHLPAVVIEETAQKVRAACGCGGTVRGRTVEIQGDQPAKVRAALEAQGFQVAGVR